MTTRHYSRSGRLIALMVLVWALAVMPAAGAALYYDTSADPGLQPGDTNDTSTPKTIAWAPNPDGSGTRVAWSHPAPTPPDDAYFQGGGVSVYSCGNMGVGSLSVSNASVVEFVTGNTSRTLSIDDSISISGDSTLRLNSYQMIWGSGKPSLAIDGASKLVIKRNKKTALTWLMGATAVTGDGGSIRFNMGSIDQGGDVTLSLGKITKSGGGAFSIDEDSANPTRYRLGSGNNTVNVDTVADDDSVSISAMLVTAGSLIKNGAGTLTLTADNDYTGGTTVNDGTLLVSNTLGSGTGSGAVALNGGTLGGTGSIAGAIIVAAGASVAPGESIGTLHGSSLVWNGDDTFAGMVFELSQTDNTSDMLELSGLLTQGAGDPLLFEFIGGKPGETYTLMSFAQTDFAEADFGIASGMDGTFALGATSLQFTAQAIADNVIPEPTSAALWGLGGLLMLLIRRRRA